MSRSRKKNNIVTQGSGGKWRQHAKRQANKRVRKYAKSLKNGNAYRKVYNSWDICDWKFDGRPEDERK